MRAKRGFCIPGYLSAEILKGDHQVGWFKVERMADGTIITDGACTLENFAEVQEWWKTRKHRAEQLLDGLPIDQF